MVFPSNVALPLAIDLNLKGQLVLHQLWHVGVCTKPKCH